MSSKLSFVKEINDYITKPESRKRMNEDSSETNYYQMSLEESLDWIMLKAAKLESERLTRALNQIISKK